MYTFEIKLVYFCMLANLGQQPVSGHRLQRFCSDLNTRKVSSEGLLNWEGLRIL